MKILEREIGSIDFAENQTRTLPLPRNYAYRCLNLLLICQLDREAGSEGGPKDSCPAQLVKNIMIRANGRDVIKNYDMESLHRLCEQRHHVRPYIYAEDFSGYGAKTNSVLKVAARIDFEMWDAVRPIDSLLDSAGLATLELIVTWGTGLDVMNDTFDGASVTVDSAQLFVSSVEAVGVPPGTAFMTNKEYMIRSQVTAASAKHQIQLPVSNLYRSIVLKTHSDGDQVDSILPFSLTNQNTITLQAGTEVFKYRIAGCLQADNRLDCEMQIPERTGSAAALNHRLQELLQEGYYVLEFVKDGRLTECLDTSKLSSLDLILDVAHPGTDDFIDVFPVELIRPAVEAAAAAG
ncbi:MAG: hypothetical protein AMJ79_11830 [Phycisphaerae bacterium SM23_30]|nr:MAG: hypothetical protein AMJ79_11830 [Phycisphaerae bacterium SM23_30]